MEGVGLMPIDYDAVRTAFYGPPLASPPDHLPTLEEVLAEHQRVRVQCTTDLGIDTPTPGLGESGSLIGGPGRPLTLIPRPVEWLLRLEPMPLEWFDYPEARRAWCVPADEETAIRERTEYLEEVIHCNLAGYPDRPSPSELAAWILAPESVPPRPGAVYEIFENMHVGQCAQMLGRGQFSVFQVARIIILSGARAPELISWLHQFAVAPEGGSSRNSTRTAPD